MSTRNRQPSLSFASSALQPISRDFALRPTAAQAMSGILRFGARSELNRCQFKRLEAACRSVYQNSGSDAAARSLLINVYTKCQSWRSEDDQLKHLICLPDEMTMLETELNQYGTPPLFVPTPDDEKRENTAITLAIQKILSNEQTRSKAMNLRGGHAKLFVSYMQTMLDMFPTMAPKLREEYIKALRKLVVEAEVWPSGLKLEGVIIDQQPIAQGGFSDVFRGKWKDKFVAVKRPRFFLSHDNSEMLKHTRREILLWRQLFHKHVLPLLGIFREEKSPLDCMVSEWMPNGTLAAFLKKPENEDTNRLQSICQIASALEYLHTHSPPIAHGDIKAGNIFVDANFRPALGDFGLSHIRYTIDRTMSSTLEAGSVRWMAPELLHSNDGDTGGLPKPTLPSDIWAFAMLMLEIFTGDKPYAKDPETSIPFIITMEHKLPERPGKHITERGLTDAVWELMKTCWNFTHPEERPTASYLLRQLETFSQETQMTAGLERTNVMFIPNALVQDIIISKAAHWKSLGVTITQENMAVMQKNIPMTITLVKGCAVPVAEACLQIEDAIMNHAIMPVTAKIKIPREFHSRLIGQGHCHHRKLESKHGVKIIFPPKNSQTSLVTLQGSADAVDKAKVDLRKMLWFERTSRDVLTVSSCVAEKVLEQRESILRSPLKDLIVECLGKEGTITLRGRREGITIAHKRIRDIEKEVEEELTDDISVDDFLHRMIEDDRQAWIDIIKRCNGPASKDSDKYPFILSRSSNGIKVRGPPSLIKALRIEIEELINIGHSCVLAKRVSTSRHQSLLDTPGGLVADMRRHAKATVYFPKSGGYKYMGKPKNMDWYDDDIDYREIVKVVGSFEECKKARAYLEARVEEQRKREQFPVYVFPALLYDTIKRKLEPMFHVLGVTEDSEVPKSTGTILSFVSQNQPLITAFGPGWKIHERQDNARGSPLMVEMRLISEDAKDLSKAGQLLEKEVLRLWRRIGILEIQSPAHVRLIKDQLEILAGQSDDLLCNVVEQPPLCRLVVGGPSTDAVENVINGAIALLEAGELHDTP